METGGLQGVISGRGEQAFILCIFFGFFFIFSFFFVSILFGIAVSFIYLAITFRDTPMASKQSNNNRSCKSPTFYFSYLVEAFDLLS